MKSVLSKRAPLAFLKTGEPAPIPEEAIALRVHIRDGRRHYQLVRSRNGAPLLVPIDTQPEDFCELVGPGIYKLDPVNENGQSLESPDLFYKIDPKQAEEEDDYGASRAEAFVSRLLKEQRQLIDRTLTLVEQQSADRVAEAERRSTDAEKRAIEHARLMSTQVERFEKALSAQAERHTRAVTAIAEQNSKLVTAIANKFGDYISGTTDLLAAHPAAGNSPTAIDIVSEHRQIRNAVADLADDENDDEGNTHDPLISLLDKSMDAALPILGPALQRLMHRIAGLGSGRTNSQTPWKGRRSHPRSPRRRLTLQPPKTHRPRRRLTLQPPKIHRPPQRSSSASQRSWVS